MKHEAPPTPLLHRRKKLLGGVPISRLIKPAAYVIVMLSCFSLGYLSAPSNSSVSKPIINTSPEKVVVEVEPTASPGAAERRNHMQVTGTVPIDDHNQFSTRCANPVAPGDVRQTIIDQVFNGTSPWQNFPPAHVSPLLRPRRIKGWGSTGAVFENLIRKVQPRTIIEVGSFLGASALHMAGLTQKLGLHDTQIVCIDDFRGWPGFQQEKFKDIKTLNGDVLLMYQFMQNVVESKATSSIMLMPFSTSSALDKLCEWGLLGDLVEVDAAHDFHSAWADIKRAHKVLRPGGVLFGHDYFTSADKRGVRRAVHLFAGLNNLQVQVDGQHWVIHPPTKQLQVWA